MKRFGIEKATGAAIPMNKLGLVEEHNERKTTAYTSVEITGYSTWTPIGPMTAQTGSPAWPRLAT